MAERSPSARGGLCLADQIRGCSRYPSNTSRRVLTISPSVARALAASTSSCIRFASPFAPFSRSERADATERAHGRAGEWRAGPAFRPRTSWDTRKISSGVSSVFTCLFTPTTIRSPDATAFSNS